jgi:alpha-galactosidase
VTLSLTPPMGWNSWNYGLNERHRADFSRLTEKTVLAQAQAMVDTGMLSAGYEYLVLDDGFQSPRRDDLGRLQGDALRFHAGIPSLVEEVQALGLKFGIYSVPGSLTCAQQYDDYLGEDLGSLGFETVDANSFAEWGVDYLKYDWCRAHLNDGLKPQESFEKMSDALKASGRDIVFSISEYGLFKSHEWAPEFANLWRTTDDLLPLWDSVMRTLDLQVNLYPYSRPGAWNDPDMLQIGNGSLTESENRAHFFLWAVLNAPLMAGNDLTKMSNEVRDLLIHPGVISIDQDWGGQQGRLVYSESDAQVWSKPMSDGSKASVLLARGENTEKFRLDELFPEIQSATEVWSGDQLDVRSVLEVPSHDALLILTK